MGEPSLLDKLREWLAGIAFDVFLWCNRMTAEQYFDMLDTERGLTTDAPEMTVGDSFPINEHSTDETGDMEEVLYFRFEKVKPLEWVWKFFRPKNPDEL